MPPQTQKNTHKADRSRSADRHAAHGNEARDERLPYRIPRQPNIPSAERSGVEASVMEASVMEESPTHEMSEDPRLLRETLAGVLAVLGSLSRVTKN